MKLRYIFLMAIFLLFCGCQSKSVKPMSAQARVGKEVQRGGTRVCIGEGCMGKKPEKAKAVEESPEVKASQDRALWSKSCSLQGIRVLNDQGGMKNFVVSPFSMCRSLGMVLLGASDRSASNLQEYLVPLQLRDRYSEVGMDVESMILGGNSDGASYFGIRRLWVDNSVNVEKDMQDKMLKLFAQDLGRYGLVSQSKKVWQEVNRWFSMVSNNELVKVMRNKDVDSSSNVLLTDAVSFNARWKIPFDEKMTVSKANFIKFDGKKVKVSMMKQRGEFYYFEDSDAQVVKMLYEGEKYSLYVVLPKQKGEGYHLRGTNLGYFYEQMKLRVIELQIPRFKVELSTDLGGILGERLLSNVFGDNSSFKALSSADEIKLKHYYQLISFSVDERGSGRAVKADLASESKSYESVEMNLNLDRPFIYCIKDETSGQIILIGQYGG